MLYTRKLLDELERTRDLFTGYSDRFGRELGAYRAALAGLGGRFPSAAALDAALAGAGAAGDGRISLGARPTREYDAWQSGRAGRGTGGDDLPALPFGREFAHHEAARAWAECLRGTTTLAVDGSQLLPWRDASVPVALVQAGIFENPHRPPAPYIKDVATAILPPEELLEADPDAADARTGEVLGYSERAVHLRRYELEIETLIARLAHHAAAGPVVAFYDGSLTVSFALKMPPAYRDRYARASRRLLAASEEHRVPVVGYIDTSYARDLITMTRALDAGLPKPRGVHDALLLRGALGWGDRTPAFLSARSDSSGAGGAEPGGAVSFVYFQAALDRPPARLELPRWVVGEAGLLGRVMDVVRAETIVGNGYPYPIEAADAVAVISARDRAQFYALFQGWAAREGLPFTFSRKALSKSRRRV